MTRNHIYNSLIFFSILLSLPFAYSQTIVNTDGDEEIILCTMPVTEEVNRIYIPPSDFIKQKLASRDVTCSNIIVNYNNFPNDIFGGPGEAQLAFQFAVDIWQTLLESPVPIRINANWTNLGANTLGSAGSAFFAEVPNGGTNTLYPAALAEKLTGAELNGTESIDINCNFNSQFANWYFGTDGNTPANDFDFVTIVLHELGHGLGVAGFGIQLGNGNGNIRRDISGQSISDSSEFFSIWDTFIEANDIFGLPQPVLDESVFPDNSSTMLAAFTQNNLACNSPLAVAANGNSPARTFAPSTFNGGSSYSHWDENTFNNSPNALMTPFAARGEAIHDPGGITLGFMADMGWSLCQNSLSTSSFDLSSVKISPNPFTEILTINLPSEISNQEFELTIVDINGRIVSNISETNNGEIILSNLSNLKSALYFLTIESKSSDLKITKKIIKQ